MGGRWANLALAGYENPDYFLRVAEDCDRIVVIIGQLAYEYGRLSPPPTVKRGCFTLLGLASHSLRLLVTPSMGERS